MIPSPPPASRLLILLLLAVLWLTPPPSVAGQPEAGGAVYVVPITGPIDLGVAPYLARVLDRAEADNAAAVILQIDTPGGRLDAVLQMQDALLDSPLRTIAFVDRTAFSAGALIAIAATEIVMTPGAVMGAATPVDGASGDAADEKVISAVRKTFKTTAEVRGRNPLVAEAMVDPNVAIEGLVNRGELLTLTTTEAVAWGYADFVAPDLPALLAATGLADRSLVETAPSLAERIVRFITEPAGATILIVVAMLLIIGDFFVEGFGLAGLAGFGLLALFFWGHMLVGLAGWEDIALVVLGVILIAVELLIIPGFGIPGVLGLAALFGGLVLAMLGRDIRAPQGTLQAALTVAIAFILIIAGLVTLVAVLPRTRGLSALTLRSASPADPLAVNQTSRGWLRWFGAEARLAGAGLGSDPAQPPAIASHDVADPRTPLTPGERDR